MDRGMFELLRACGEVTVYVMGGSFIFGSLFTILMLLILDMFKAQRLHRAGKKDAE